MRRVKLSAPGSRQVGMAQKAVVVTTPMEVTLMTTRNFVTPTFLALVLSFVGPRAVSQQSAEVQGVPVNMVIGVEPKHGDEVPTITQQDMMGPSGRHPRQRQASSRRLQDGQDPLEPD